MSILVTGGAGFIGSNFVLDWLAQSDEPVINLDALTYAGNRENLATVDGDARHIFVHGDIGDFELVAKLLAEHQPRAVLNFAAESHVDRSIHGPEDFIQTNIVGTYNLLQAARGRQARIRIFHHVSTDEVFGSLGETGYFTEATPYSPRSPYSASKAASDHLVRAFHETYGLPVTLSNCSNNYGPYQFPEKLVPLMILNALEGKPLPVYGDGRNVRDWLHVRDHATAVWAVMTRAAVGETYCIGGRSELRNLEVVQSICRLVDAQAAPLPSGKPRERLVTFVKDRPGHDHRYAIDCSRLEAELGWKPSETAASGFAKTVAWYLANPEWVEAVRTGAYRTWIERNYTAR